MAFFHLASFSSLCYNIPTSMPPISSFTGQQLLDKNIVAQISQEAETLLRNQDIAGAWQGSRHLKDQLSQLPADSVAPVLPDYRKISANLKTLALPLLDKDDVANLLQNNLGFLEAQYEPFLLSGLSMWLLGQPDGQEAGAISAFKQVLPKDGPLTPRLLKIMEESGQREAKAADVKISPPAPPPATIKKDDMFDDHEAKELAQESKKIGEIGVAALATGGAGTAGEAILKLVGREQDQAAFLKRAQALVTSRLRDVRTTADIKEYLHRPWAVGGLGIDEERVEAASKLIEQEYQKVHSSQFIADKSAPAPSLPVISAPIEPAPPVMPALVEPAPLPPPPAPAKPLPASPPADPVLLQDKPKPIIRPIRTANFNDRPRLDDVKTMMPAAAPMRTVGAADEFKLITVADWRGLGDPAAAVSEILRRAGLLRDQSLADYTRAARLFRESELFADYVALGKASLEQGKKLAQTLADSNLNPHAITEDEFFAIASLNSRLK